MSNDVVHIHSIRIAGWLMYNGFMYDDIVANKKYPTKNVYVFTDNMKIKEVMSLLPEREGSRSRW